MKYLTFLLILFFANRAFTQQTNTTIYIEYKQLQEYGGSTFKQWINKDSIIYTTIASIPYYKEIIIMEDGKLVKVSDRIKYAKEFEEHRLQDSAITVNLKQPFRTRKNNSNILYSSIIVDYNKKKYYVVDTLAEMSNWVLHNDTLHILGFKCQKATTNFSGVNYTAFFTTELNFTYGPRNFRGLPGLILKVNNDDESFGYIVTQIKYPFKGVMPTVESDGQFMTAKEFAKIAESINQLRMQKMMNLKNIKDLNK